VDIPLAMVEVRGLDLLQALRQAKLQTTEEAPRVGLVNFEVPSPVVAQFDSLFGLGLVQIAYQGPHDAPACVQKLRASGVGAVVAPGLVADLAEQAGMASVLLYSDISVRQALSDAMLLARHRRAERDRHQRLETVLHQLQDGVAAVDERGRICALNPRMAALLGGPVEALHGRMLDEVAPTLGTARALAGEEGGEEVVQLALRTLVVRRAPIVENGLVTGALLVCRDPAVIQRADRSLRASQRQRAAGCAGALRTIWAAVPLPSACDCWPGSMRTAMRRCSFWAKAGPARSWWRKAFTARDGVQSSHFWRSTAQRSAKACWRASFSVTRKALLPEPGAAARSA
jgi:propionate catabolism operon transcriptional regulator